LDLAERDARTVSFEHLEERAAELLGEEDGPRITLRLRRLAAFQALEAPIVLLVGGATGTGKSTVATEVAHVLGITRVTSTDFIRQTIRAFFSERSMPSVHHSSFEGDPVLLGFLGQTRNVLVGVDGAMDKYLDQLDEIRQIQDYLVERAEKHRVPVIESSNIERATTAVLELVLALTDRVEMLV